MPDINYVTAQISPQKIVEGYYTVEDGLLTMVYANGEPVIIKDDAGTDVTFVHRLNPDDSHRAIASMLTRKVRKLALCEKIDGFSDPLTYANQGYA